MSSAAAAAACFAVLCPTADASSRPPLSAPRRRRGPPSTHARHRQRRRRQQRRRWRQPGSTDNRPIPFKPLDREFHGRALALSTSTSLSHTPHSPSAVLFIFCLAKKSQKFFSNPAQRVSYLFVKKKKKIPSTTINEKHPSRSCGGVCLL